MSLSQSEHQTILIVVLLAVRASTGLPVASDNCPKVVKHRTGVCPALVLTKRRSVKTYVAAIRYVVGCGGDPPV